MTPEYDTSIYFDDINDIDFVAIVDKRARDSDGYWNSQKKDNQNRRLREIRQDNRKIYTSQYVEEQLIDDRYEEVFNDNRQFVAVRTIVPFVTGQITAPEVTPANKDDLSKFFASDFEDVLQLHAERVYAKYKIRLSVQDLLIGLRLGIGKWRYDREKDTVVYEHISPESVIVGRRSKLLEEPDFLRQTLKRTPGDLLKQFPDKKEKIFELFGVSDETPDLDEKEYDISEDWIWLRNKEGDKVLVVGWSYNKYCFGKILDPNWDEGGQNLSDEHMMPYVFYNLLNDGSGYIDQTSYSEQAKYSQKQYNKRGQVIAESARYGGTGVPIFAKGAITQKDAAKVHFSPVQRVLLDTDDVNKAFTTWQQGQLPAFIVEDKGELRASVDDIYGVNSISRGQQSDQKTATQDVLLRNQAEGRQSDILDMLEAAMTRFYKLEAQMMFRYFTDVHYYNYIGSDGEFVSVAISQKDMAKNLDLQISVKAGTSLPLDRAQKRATLIQLAKMNKIGTITLFRELGLFDDPEKAFKEFIEEQINPNQLIQDTDDQLFDRDAKEDLVTVIGGKTPKERDDITPEYVNFLNEWLLTDKYKMLTQAQQARVSDFVDEVIAKAKRKADKLALQPNAPLAPNAAGAPPTPMGQPGMPGAPASGALPPELASPQMPTGMSGALPGAASAVQ